MQFVLAMICSIATTEYIYDSIDDLIYEAEERKFLIPYELTNNDYDRLYALRKVC